MPQVINVKEMYDTCNKCEWNKTRQISSYCRGCLYDALRTQLENEKNRQSDYEKKCKKNN